MTSSGIGKDDSMAHAVTRTLGEDRASDIDTLKA